MSERDLQRMEVLSKVTAGPMTLVSAAHVLNLSTRQVRRLLNRMSERDLQRIEMPCGDWIQRVVPSRPNV